MALSEVGLFPLFSVVFGLLAFFIGYAIALSNDHVDAFLPFISDCGTMQPESGIFGILLNISAFFLGITVFLIYRHTVDFHKQKSENNSLGGWKIFAGFLLLLGWVACIGLAMVANFQEGPRLTEHDIGAFTFFIGIIIYFWGQIIIAYSLRPHIVPLGLLHFRVLLNLVISALLVFHMICLFAEPFVKKVNGVKPKDPTWPNNIARVHSGSPFYANHLCTTISEWVLALLLELMILSYSYDFAMNNLHAPKMSRAHSASIQGQFDILSEDERAIYSHPAYALSPFFQNNESSVPRGGARVKRTSGSSMQVPPNVMIPRASLAPPSNYNNNYQYF